MNNHVPATACLTIALWGYHTLDGNSATHSRIVSMILGLLLGLAVTIDLPSGIFVVLLVAGYGTRLSRSNSVCGIVGMCIPVIVHAAVMMSLTGSPLPFQLNHDYYMYEESYWRNPMGVDALNHSWGLYLFNMTFGRVGIFILYPFLFVGFMALCAGVFRRDAQVRYWNIGVLGAVCILSIYYVTGTNNYGGVSFGFRWLIITTPFLVISASSNIDQVQSRALKVLVIMFVVVSLVSATQCRLAPWSVDQEWPVRLFGPLVL